MSQLFSKVSVVACRTKPARKSMIFVRTSPKRIRSFPNSESQRAPTHLLQLDDEPPGQFYMGVFSWRFPGLPSRLFVFPLFVLLSASSAWVSTARQASRGSGYEAGDQASRGSGFFSSASSFRLATAFLQEGGAWVAQLPPAPGGGQPLAAACRSPRPLKLGAPYGVAFGKLKEKNAPTGSPPILRSHGIEWFCILGWGGTPF